MAGSAAALAFGVVLLLASGARAGVGECVDGKCGMPQTGGGGCGCGGGGLWPPWPSEPDDHYIFADDRDGDQVEDDDDNCPLVANTSQHDSDADGFGDPCDLCPAVPDEEQIDSDGDGMGDACDDDRDNDGKQNAADNCPLVPNLEQTDTDNDGLGNACDPDDDNDLIVDLEDNCPLVKNPLQQPPEALGVPPEKCDTDNDGDFVFDARDNCPGVANIDQRDTDGDGSGDLCDPDMDADRVQNRVDNCERQFNPRQLDGDRDGRGDACDARFCYVVAGNEKQCLDPQNTFTLYSPRLHVKTGEPALLRLYANRQGAGIEYLWDVIARPEGSTADVQNPGGVVHRSTPFEYRYPRGRTATFTADEPGEYRIRLVGQLVFADTVNPKFPRLATYRVTVVAEGESTRGGCSTAPGSRAGLSVWVLLGLLVLIGLRR